MIKILLSIITILFTLCSCSINYDYVNIREEIRNSLSTKNNMKAINLVNGENYYSVKNSVLLKKLEQGTVYYDLGKYYQALNYFNDAEKIAEELYTIKISSKLKSIISDNFDDYSGEKYEKSLIYFYKSLINYNLYLIGKYEAYSEIVDNKKNYKQEKILSIDEKVEHLRKARSNIMKWDSLLNSFKMESKQITDYNLDLLEKIWGAFIFEENGGTTDLERALSMYKSAKKILHEQCSIYPSYNKKYSDVIKSNNFNNLKNNIDNTAFFTSVNNFIDNKIDQLINRKSSDNLILLISSGYIPLKKTKIIQVPMEVSFFANQSPDFFNFLAYLSITNSTNNLGEFKIQLPYIEQYEINNNFVAEIYDENNNKLHHFTITLVEPIADLVYTNFESKKTLLYSKITTSTLAKYASLLLASYELYKTTLEKSNELMAILVANTAYISSVKNIENFSRPDLRQWTTLPKSIYFSSKELKSGKYILKIKSINLINGKEQYVYECLLDLTNGKIFKNIKL